MPEEHITDDQILKQMRLTKDELRDLLKKYNDFLNSLDKAQRRAFMKGQKSLQMGADTLRHVQPTRLEQLLRELAPKNGAICIIGNELNGTDGPET